MATESKESNVVVLDDEPDEEPGNEPQETKPTTDKPPPQTPKKAPRFPRKRKTFQNDRYNSAYGDYSGGYGPPGGWFGRNFGRPPHNFGPPPPMFPPGPHGPHPGPQGPPPFMWGRGFGPMGPPMRRQPMDDKIIKYLMKCGVGKEHLKNLPRNLLQLLEPEYCGLCAQSFDSFANSRIHYISKNHIKFQKKWLSQQSENGFRRVKEIALKSRDLYCELCDVHITSKSHSDSHYSGKPHRAIVEGRKNPKNPILLQRGMDDRVAQLIRREKKFIKAIGEEQDADKEKDIKTLQPDLYCEICKTSVTCSEQMTMHLNGKRHLSKEKQHILQVMKGGPPDSAGEPQEKASDDDMEEEENVKKEVGDKEDNAEDQFDWGNGSGTWEEGVEGGEEGEEEGEDDGGEDGGEEGGEVKNDDAY